MSGRHQFAVWGMQLPSTDKYVLLALANRANASGVCYPSAKGIASDTGLNVKTVRAALDRLENGGFIKVQNRAGTSPLFELDPDQNWVYPKEGVPESGYTQNREDYPAQNRVGGVPKNGQGVYPKTGNEPNKNLTLNQTIETDTSDRTKSNTVDFEATIKEQLEAVSLPPSDNFLADPVHILTAPELVRLCAKNKVRIGSSSALYDICKKGILTVMAAERLIADFKRTNHSVSYLIGMFRNFANEKGQTNGRDYVIDDNWQPPF